MSVKAHQIPALFLAITTGSLALAGCGISGSTAYDQRAFGLGGSRLVIDDSSSDLRVVPGNGTGIEVQRWLSGTAAEPGHSSWTMSGGRLQLSIDCAGLVFSCGSRFEVAVPRGVGVVVNSGSGSDTVSGLSGPVTINGESGTVHVNDVSGPLEIDTSSGDITATAIGSATLHVTSDQGSADISFVAAPRSVAVRCSVGNATVNVPTSGQRYHVLVSSGTGNALSKVPDDRRSDSVVQVSSGHGDAAVLPAS